MKKFQAQVSYTFTGTVDVNAESKEDARRIISEDFGVCSPGISTSNSGQVIDWDINMHPDKETIKLSLR